MKYEFLSELIAKPISGEWGQEGDKIPVIRSTNFTMDGILDLSNVKYRDIEDSKIAKKKLQKGDILIEKSGGSLDQPVGRVVFFDEEGDFLFSNFTSALRPKKSKVFPKYLNYILLSAYKGNITSYFQNRTTGIINLQITRYVDELQIPLPPLPTQRKIAEVLDKADAIRKRSQKILAKYDQLAQSVFLEMFGDPVKNEKGWEVKKLSEFGKITSGSTPSREIESYYNGNIPWVKTGEVNGKVIKSTFESITQEGLAHSSCRLYPKQSILIAMYGQGKTRGQVGILGIEATTNQACAVIPPSNKINSKFLFDQLKYRYADLRSLARGGNQANLNCGLIKDYKVIFPPIIQQEKFASIITQIEKQKAQTQLELDRAEELYQSLLQRAFTGALFPETIHQELTHT